MILPERTVDAWTATYITGRRWRARLWAPTERAKDEGYDLAVGVGKVRGAAGLTHQNPWPDKVFVLEHKGVDEDSRGNPLIFIRVMQLRKHRAADHARGGKLIYYLMPDPTWRGRQHAPVGTLPPVTLRRTRGPTWTGFQRWAHVAHVDAVTAMLQSIHKADPTRFKPRTPRGRHGPDWICALTIAELRLMPNSVLLRDFITGVRECTHGRRVSTLPSASASTHPHEPKDTPEPALSLQQALGLDESPDIVHLNTDKHQPAIPRATLRDAFNRPAHTTFYGIGDTTEPKASHGMSLAR